MSKNICCRIFKEQFDLIQQLPKKEREKVLFYALKYAFSGGKNALENELNLELSELGKCVLNLLVKNLVCKEFSDNYGGARVGAGRKNRNQIENQNDNQIENQNDCAYISVSESVNNNNNIYNNNNNKFSGIRTSNNNFTPPTLEQVLEYAKQQNEMAFVGGFRCSQQTATEFFCHYDAIGWVIGNETKTPIKNWQSKLRLWALSPNKYKTKQEIIDDDIPEQKIVVGQQ